MKVINVLAALAIVGISNVEAASQDVAMRFAPVAAPMRHRPAMPHLFGEHTSSVEVSATFTQLIETAPSDHHVKVAVILMEEVREAYTSRVVFFHKIRKLIVHIKEHTHPKFHKMLFLLMKLVEKLEDEEEIYQYSRLVLIHVGHVTYVSYVYISVGVDEPAPREQFLKWLASKTEEILALIKEVIVLKAIHELVREIFMAFAAYFDFIHWRPTDEEFAQFDCPDCENNFVQFQEIRNDESMQHGKWSAKADGHYRKYESGESRLNALALKEDAVAIEEAAAILSKIKPSNQRDFLREYFNASSSSSSSSDDSDDSDDDDDQAATKNDDDDQAATKNDDDDQAAPIIV